jgi:hypothetical protein
MVFDPQILHDSNRFYAKAGSVLSDNIVCKCYHNIDRVAFKGLNDMDLNYSLLTTAKS